MTPRLLVVPGWVVLPYVIGALLGIYNLFDDRREQVRAAQAALSDAQAELVQTHAALFQCQTETNVRIDRAQASSSEAARSKSSPSSAASSSPRTTAASTQSHTPSRSTGRGSTARGPIAGRDGRRMRRERKNPQHQT
jgi:hypothetical protein